MPTIHTVELPDLPVRPPAKASSVAEPGGGFVTALPLRGLTVLAVEDSRFASEAMRLMCQRLGARLRRAESITTARAHLRLYRPDVVIVDLGLPDGRGEGLIREIVLSPHAAIILGMSGDPAGRGPALAAGADGFLDKPLESLAAFRDLLLRHLPDRPDPLLIEDAPLAPDTLALRDDLAHAADLIDAGVTEDNRSYLTGFLTGLAAHAHDADLARALADAGPPDPGLTRLGPLLRRRLASAPSAFGGTPGQNSVLGLPGSETSSSSRSALGEE